MTVHFVSGLSGCLTFKEDVQVYGFDGVPTPIARPNIGRVCIGGEGYDACDTQPVAVENTTWTSIKRQYRLR